MKECNHMHATCLGFFLLMRVGWEVGVFCFMLFPMCNPSSSQVVIMKFQIFSLCSPRCSQQHHNFVPYILPKVVFISPIYVGHIFILYVLPKIVIFSPRQALYLPIKKVISRASSCDVLIKINNCQKTIVELGRHRFPLINANMNKFP